MSFLSPEVRIPRITVPHSLEWEDFEARFGNRIKPEDLGNVALAFSLAKSAHKNQFRDTGEPYFSHCIMTVSYLIEAGCRYGPQLWAGFLHDVPEDNWRYLLKTEAKLLLQCHRDRRKNDAFDIYGNGAIAWLFGEETSKILKAITKSKVRQMIPPEKKEAFELRYQRQILNGPLRTGTVKASDHLHNLRTMPPSNRTRIERKIIDTRKWYIPIFEKAAEEFPLEGAILLREINEELKILEEAA